ncbi:hypothetical protein RVBP21_2560 [Pseudomonas phage BRkr]|nr:hypothetical protein RVBP21_2560 [Pseudomonas phage BRkr]
MFELLLSAAGQAKPVEMIPYNQPTLFGQLDVGLVGSVPYFRNGLLNINSGAPSRSTTDNNIRIFDSTGTQISKTAVQNSYSLCHTAGVFVPTSDRLYMFGGRRGASWTQNVITMINPTVPNDNLISNQLMNTSTYNSIGDWDGGEFIWVLEHATDLLIRYRLSNNVREVMSARCPVILSGAYAFCHKGNFYVMGGWKNISGSWVVNQDVYKYTGAINTWTLYHSYSTDYHGGHQGGKYWNGTFNYTIVKDGKIHCVRYYIAEKQFVVTETNIGEVHGTSVALNPSNGDLYLIGGSDIVIDDALFNTPERTKAAIYKFTIPIPPSKTEWEVMANAPYDSRGSTAVVIDDELYMFGGYTSTGAYRGAFNKYNPETNTWNGLFTGSGLSPSARANMCAAANDTHMYLFSGSNQSADFWRYNVATNDWTAITPASPGSSNPVFRTQATMVHYNGKLYLLGGNNESDALFVYDIASNMWSKRVAQGGIQRSSHRAVVVGEYMYVYGGFVNGSQSGRFDRMNMNTFAWESLPTTDGPGVNSYGVMLTNDEEIIYIGGVDEDKRRKANAYNIQSRTWRKLPELPNGVNDGYGGFINGTAYVGGGLTGASNNTITDKFYRLGI